MRSLFFTLSLVLSLSNGTVLAAAAPPSKYAQQLMDLPALQRATVLGNAVGKDCVGAKVVYIGEGDDAQTRNRSFWRLFCEDGRSFLVQIADDRTGTIAATDCRDVKPFGHVGCYSKF